MRSVCLASLLLFTLLTIGCTPLYVDPTAGGEMVMVKTMDRPDDYDMKYLRSPTDGPMVYESNAWWFLWRLPYNHPDLGLWLEQELPAGASAANIRSSVQMPWYGPFLFFPTLGAIRVERVRYEVDPVRVSWLTGETHPELILEPGSPDFMDQVDPTIVEDEN